ncbi:Spb1 C-terminal domain-containing protein [Mycotypha africana]|uniref:Spb1 C-terminal domain-containing protein n=1 Tax=Mycotypha africana TaxID=64632 RepID=UPI002300E7E6|nr:Spb1 C-terminal domain-containing protein [Mycotypha africana]KAI8988105.1 Spb1 C-terminal domain-containing protein [Mycotypha africana]
MGKAREKKNSKGRLDKYYHLAKEQGYRARSAFKLIQLNKKFNFLEKSRVLIDLCAAPGGWLQVATKYMPQQSLIIGVDLAPIKPIPGVITFQDDITTERCRQNLRQEMKTWKADVVLHDGAPNVGKAWIHDAFSQSELVLVSLKLATEFLSKGGIFVTKVFRSKDYNKLLWVFQQLFRKVEATKPPSSRNVSAEIFVVCRDYIAPKRIDPRMLDPKAVFSDVGAEEPKKMTDIFKPEKKHRQREGYEEGDYTLHKKIDVMEFIRSQDPIHTLGSYNQFTWDSDEAKELLKRDITTEDVKVNCEDLKVLGKSDFKTLLRWRSALREEYKMDKKEEEESKMEEAMVEAESMDEDEMLEAELAHLTKEEAAKKKREKRKANEKKMKLIQRMQLNMIVPTDIALDENHVGQDEIFNIKKIKQDESLAKLQEGDMSFADALEDEEEEGEDDIQVDNAKLKGRIREMDYDIDNDEAVDSDEEYERDLEAQMDEEYARYKQRRAEKDAKFRAKQVREEQDEWTGFDDGKEKDVETKDSRFNSDSDASSSDESDHDTASDSSSDDDSDSENETLEKTIQTAVAKSMKTGTTVTKSKKSGNSLMNDLGEKAALSKKTSSGLTTAAAMFFDQDIFHDAELDDIVDKEEAEDSSDDEEFIREQSRKRKRQQEDEGSSNEEEEEEADSDFEIEQMEEDAPLDEERWDGKADENSKAMKEAIEKGLTTPEAMTLARQLANKEKTVQDLIDEGFTKEAFRDKDGLPSWFLDDEKHHNKPNLPVTKEAMDQLRAKLKALNARPIKKVQEAKARKKFKAAQRLAKAQKKATDIAENPDMTEKEKAKNITKLIARASKSKPKKEVKVVVAKGANRGIKGRPKGVKGRYKMVDGVMKNERRAQKRREKKMKKGKRH